MFKVAVVVGHNKKAQGAYSNRLNYSEFDFNTKVVEEMVILAVGLPDVEIKPFFRDYEQSSYIREIHRVYRDVNEYDPDVSIELHFNAGHPRANGSEMLYFRNSVKGKELAEHLQDAVIAEFGFRDRGAKEWMKGNRGWRSLALPKAPAVITEPFFGSSRKDCLEVEKDGIKRLASAYLEGLLMMKED